MRKSRGESSSCSRNEDRISKLPDFLIHRILSMVDMKYVVQTCVLSKRWRYIWTSQPVLHLHFDGYLHRNEKSFVNFVHKVLSLRDSSDIHTFRLDGRTNRKITARDLYKWIAGAIIHDVQELYIGMCIYKDFEIPACLCTSKSLTKLELGLSSDGDEERRVILPNAMSLPRLKTLHLFLEGVSLNDENLANKFPSCIPSLESLVIDYYGSSKMNLNVSNLPNLESLFMRSCGFAGMNINISFPKLKYFELDNSELEGEIHENTYDVKLYAPSLASIILKGYMPTSFTVENLSSVVRADMDIRISADRDIWMRPEGIVAEKKDCYTQLAMRFLRGLHNAKVLKLNDSFLQTLGGSPDILLLYSQPLEFCNLQHLELSVCLPRDSMRSIFYLLKISPSIESLYLKLEDSWDTPFYPFCDKHAMVLEKVLLWSCLSTEEGLKLKEEFSEMLLTFPRDSANVMISYQIPD